MMNVRFWHIADRPTENSGSSQSAYTLSMVCLVVLNSRAMTQMLIPALICATTVVSVLDSELEDVQTEPGIPSPDTRLGFIKARSTSEDMRRGQRWCAGDMSTVCDMVERISLLTSYGHSLDSDRRQVLQAAKEHA